ncbi:MAG: Tol-Pal system protein TolB, partial [Xanthomonadales bacterium]|nr:Tol-Pal system protein TolB [Xanthomonadales bacterium]
MKRLQWFFVLFGLMVARVGIAQTLAVGPVSGNEAALPVAVVPFAFEGAGLPPDTDISAVIGADLSRSGQFRALSRQDIVETPARPADVKFATWRLLKQDFLVIGRISDADAGALR